MSVIPLERKAKSAHTSPAPASREAALATVRELLPRIRARAARADTDRRVPSETIAEIVDSGLFGVATPTEQGGCGLGFAALVEVTTELASACGSTGWVFGVLAGHSWLLNFFPRETQDEVHGDGRALSATVFRLNGTATRNADGVRITDAKGAFCSGVDHSSWVVVGIPVQSEGAAPEPHFMLVPRSDIEIVDDWFTAGMRGTGSRTILIKDAQVPAWRMVALKDMAEIGVAESRRTGNPLLGVPWSSVLPFSLIGAPLGMARGTLRNFVEAASQRMASFSELQLAEQSATFARLSEAAADIDAAYALVMANAEFVDRIGDVSEITPLVSARIARDWAWAAQKSRYAATRLFEAAGGTGIYDSSEMQRLWRDVNSAAQHFAFTWDGAMAMHGRALLGLAPTRFGIKGR
jgi:3-hydroxy-9,10-secoandrosta-1,3,5(10)-triene-9,17-dione monooxygenase